MHPVEGQPHAVPVQQHPRQVLRLRSLSLQLTVKLRRAQVPEAHGIASLLQCLSAAPPQQQALQSEMSETLLCPPSRETHRSHQRPTYVLVLGLYICKHTCQNLVIWILSLHALGSGCKDIRCSRRTCLSGNDTSETLTTRARHEQALRHVACMQHCIVGCRAGQSFCTADWKYFRIVSWCTSRL